MTKQMMLKNVSLAPLTTFKIGGNAKYFLKANTVQEIIESIKWAKDKDLDFFILGGGSNILFSDKGFNGLVIKINSIKNGIVLLPNQTKYLKILVWAGNSLSDVINFASNNGGQGLEQMAGIPGTIGGAVRGNAGAFGISMSDFVEQVSVLRNNKIINLKNKNIKFSYRDSIFKHNQDIILNIVLCLKKISLKKNKNIIEDSIKKRSKSQPKKASAGCIFKNIKLNNISKEIKKSGLIIDSFEKTGIIPAGLLIDKCGLKGKVVGNAQISQKHANFIINKKTAKAKDVLLLINKIKKTVKNKFNIVLEEEIKYV